MQNFETFKEITIGGTPKEKLMQNLVANEVKFNKYAEMLFAHTTFAPPIDKEEVSLAKVTLSDFKLDNPCSFQVLVNRATSVGLKLCPLYLAAFLRLNLLDQPEGPYLTVASAKPENEESYPNGFYLRNHENTLWLRGYRADDICEWPKDNEFVFLKEHHE